MPQNYTGKKGDYKRPEAKKYLYNIDTFWYNVDADNYQEMMDSGLRDFLIAGRTHVVENPEEPITIEVNLPSYENNIIFNVQGGQPPLYQYSIRNEDIAIYFSKNKKTNGQLPMKVQINQFVLWEKGLVKAYRETLQILRDIGFNVSSGKLNRIDFAVHSDQWIWNLEDLKTFVYPRNFADDNKPNIQKADLLTGDFETVYFGSRGRLLMRIYDKSKEAQKKEKLYFLQMYDRYGMDPYNVWNVEIECRRDYLKEYVNETGYRLFDDLEQVFKERGISKLWTHLMTKFDHPNSAHWKQLKKGKNGIFEDCVGHLDREKDIDSSLHREVAQIRGRLKKFVVGEKENDLGAALSKLIPMIQDYEEKKEVNFSDEVDKKKRQYLSNSINKKAKKIGSVVRPTKPNDMPDGEFTPYDFLD